MGTENTGDTAAKADAAVVITPALTMGDLAGQIATASEKAAEKAAAANPKEKTKTKTSASSDSEKAAAAAKAAEEAAADEGDDEGEGEDEDDGAGDEGEGDEADAGGEGEDEGEDEEADAEGEDEGEDEVSEELTIAEQALELAIKNGKLPLGLKKRLEKADAKVAEAISAREAAEAKLAEGGTKTVKPVGIEIANAKNLGELRDIERKAKVAKDFCDDRLEEIVDDPEGVAKQLFDAKVFLKNAAGEDDYSVATMRRWLLSTRSQARERLSDEIPERREQLESEHKAYLQTCDLYPALRDAKSPLAIDVSKIVAKMVANPFTDPDLNASKHRIALWAIRGRQAELADLAKKGGSAAATKPKPKVKSPNPKGGAAGSSGQATRKEQNANALRKVESNPTESNLAEALASGMSGE